MNSNKISVIIVAFNNEKTIRSCLGSVIKFADNPQIIVVDNSSQDKTLEIVDSFLGKITLINPGENLGFAKSNNLGVSQAQGEYLVFLNPDAEVLGRGSLEKLVDVLEKNHDFGLVGPQLILPDGQIQKTTRNLPTPMRAFQEYILGQKGTYNFYLPECKFLCEVESVVGACMAIKKDVFVKAGKFDEKYFLYFEDLELCRSVKKLGLKVGFLPEVKIRHIVGVSGGSKITLSLLQESAKKYHGLINYLLMEAIFIPGRMMNRLRGLKG